MSTISRRRRQLKIKENNLKYFLTPKPSREGGTEEAPASSSGSRGKGLSVRGNDKENLECILDVGSKLTAQCKDLFNDKEVRVQVSYLMGTLAFVYLFLYRMCHLILGQPQRHTI